MAKKKGPRSSRTHTSKYSDKETLNKPGKRHSHTPNRRRDHAERLPVRRNGCYNPEVRRGLGAVLFIMGFPTAIAGIVMTVVDATDNEEGSKYPSAFAYVGPLLITLAMILIIVGFILSTPVLSKALGRCFAFDDPHSFCRVHCPKLSQCIKPDEIIVMNRHAMNALKTEPGKPSLKKPQPNGNGVHKEEDSLSQEPLESGEPSEPPPVGEDPFDNTADFKLGPRVKSANKGVRFSESDLDHFRDARAASVTSSDNGSVASLRNCKVHPKSGIWWTESSDEAALAKKVVLQSKENSTTPLQTTEL